MIHNRHTFMNKFVKSLIHTCRDIFIDSLIRILIDVHTKKDRNQKQIKRELFVRNYREVVFIHNNKE